MASAPICGDEMAGIISVASLRYSSSWRNLALFQVGLAAVDDDGRLRIRMRSRSRMEMSSSLGSRAVGQVRAESRGEQAKPDQCGRGARGRTFLLTSLTQSRTGRI